MNISARLISSGLSTFWEETSVGGGDKFLGPKNPKIKSTKEKKKKKKKKFKKFKKINKLIGVCFM